MTPNINNDPNFIIDSGLKTLQTELNALVELKNRFDHEFAQAVNQILNCSGRVIVAGLGKSGHIARKISATLSSTGTPSYFLHAAEAIHGDLGLMTSEDILIAISYSGSGTELMSIISVAKRLGTHVIAITGDPNSSIAVNANTHINVHVQKEACPLNLAPTASTTATLVMGDAIAIACLQAKGFNEQDFARSHPGGALGRKLLTYVRDIMRTGQDLPTVTPETFVTDSLAEMSNKSMGMIIVVNQENQPIGIFTDGDLRRLIVKKGDIRKTAVKDCMTTNPHTIKSNILATHAAAIMEQKKINQILVTDESGTLIGAIQMHDLLAKKVI